MKHYIKSIADALRGMGYEVTSDDDSLTVDGETVFFHGSLTAPRVVRVLGRKYKVNEKSAGEIVVSVLRHLPGMKEQTALYRNSKSMEERAAAIQSTRQDKSIRVWRNGKEYEFSMVHADPEVIRAVLHEVESITVLPFELENPDDRLVASDYAEERGYTVWAEQLRR